MGWGGGGGCGGWTGAMWNLTTQGNMRNEICWEYKKKRKSAPYFPTIHNFLLFLFPPVLPPRLAASQSIPINMQRLCTLSSCSSKWHNPWPKKDSDEKLDFLLDSTFFSSSPPPSSTFLHSKIMFLQINQHLQVAVEARKGRWRIASLRLVSTEGRCGSC